MMTKPTDHMTEAELAEHYDTHRDADEWGEPEPVQHPPRRQVTISVRFSEREIDQIRDRAAQLGMKPTAYIREAVLRADQQETGTTDLLLIAHKLSAIETDLPAAERLIRLLGELRQTSGWHTWRTTLGPISAEEATR
jgi:hypothetical protein